MGADSRPTLLIATGNPGKVETLSRFLADLPFRLAGLKAVPDCREVAETGSTFEENARLKACGYARQSGTLTLADDSGLEVDALDGRPGVYSARYGGSGLSDGERCQRLLQELSDVPDGRRQAGFVCVVAIAGPDGELLGEFRGTCRGRLTREMRGEQGFGYDPLFVPDGHEATYAEAGPALKDRLGHRAVAMRKARTLLEELARTQAI